MTKTLKSSGEEGGVGVGVGEMLPLWTALSKNIFFLEKEP